MLATQVQYWNYRENQRHNLATEEQARNELRETNRSNLIREGISQGTLAETVRHNKEGEKVSWSNLAEVTRHNQMQEKIGFQNLNEIQRHNQAEETVLPYVRDKYQMETTTGYVDTASKTGDRLAATSPGKLGVAALALAGMIGASDIAHQGKGGNTYGHFSTKGTSKNRTATTHSGKRPTLSDSDRQRYMRY